MPCHFTLDAGEGLGEMGGSEVEVQEGEIPVMCCNKLFEEEMVYPPQQQALLVYKQQRALLVCKRMQCAPPCLIISVPCSASHCQDMHSIEIPV
jgi:hypothetical protein